MTLWRCYLRTCSIVELLASIITLRFFFLFFFVERNRNAGRVARTNAFEGHVSGVDDDDDVGIELAPHVINRSSETS